MRELLNSLSGMRFIAAALIAFHHTAWMYPLSKFIDDHVNADLGVTFFFVLSGFILYYTHNDISSKAESFRFITARIARIWPLHIFTMLTVLCIFPSPWGYPGDASGWLKILSNAFLLHAWLPFAKYFFSLNGPSWSISVELFFYALFPFFLYGFKKNWPYKLILSFILGLTVVISIQKMQFPSLQYGDPSMGPNQWASMALPLVRLTEFLVGMLACDFWLRIRHSIVFNTASITVLEVIALLLGVFALSEFPRFISLYFGGDVVGPWMIRTLAAPLFAVIIFIFAYGKGIPSKLIGSKWMVILGEISFSLYMTHEIVARTIANYLPSLLFKDGLVLGPLFFWIICLSVSFASWKLIEKPCRKFILAKYDNYFPVIKESSLSDSRKVT